MRTKRGTEMSITMTEEMLAYFDTRCSVHEWVLRGWPGVTKVQAEVGAARMAGRDFERRYGVTVEQAVRATVKSE
jgi:hypothetical protein